MEAFFYYYLSIMKRNFCFEHFQEEKNSSIDDGGKTEAKNK